MNGIPALAQAVQSQGRNNDTQLVHMTPNEVQGLESLAMAYGGSLTTNPRTGLKEAGFLDNILPMLAGAALTIGSGGAINPLMAAGIVGGGTGLATGNLEKGLMAGLGAYGGAGLGGGLTAAGATTAAPGTGAGYAGQTVTGNLAQAGEGAKALFTDPAARSAFMGQAGTAATPATGVGGLGGLAKYGGATLAPMVAADQGGGVPAGAPGMVRPYKYDAGKQTNLEPRTGAPGESSSELTYFKPSFTAYAPYEPGKGSQAELEDEMRRRGVMSLAAGSQGPVRMLRGGGDATSDSMMGTIDGEEPVKLATGEVVIDGRAVSEIGNGDNEAGAKKIEAAIERIHKIRQKAKRGKPSPADKTFAAMIA